MGSAQLDFLPIEAPPAAAAEPRASELGPQDLRQQVAERLAAHRQRRERNAPVEASPTAPRKSPKNRIAAAVAERYAHTPSYRAVLAEQAKRAIQEAAAAAEIAQRNAEAVAAAQQELLGELELWNAPQTFTPETANTIETRVVKPAPTPPEQQTSRSAGITVRLYEDLPPFLTAEPHAPIKARTTSRITDPEAMALDAEIEFRQAPVWEEDFYASLEPNVPLPANLLEFPRQLIAARKARPRIAEGPLRDESTPRTAQLRIFEVEPEQIATIPSPPPAAPEWTNSIRLDVQPQIQYEPRPEIQPAAAITAPEAAPALSVMASLLPPQTAPLQLRLMSGMVDGILVAAAALAFIAAYAHAGGEIPIGAPAALAILGVLTVVHVLYQLLFFTFSDETPGMRYARIGLCTFTDENPTRAEMRRRILAQFVAVCPLGIGLLWILLDDDALGWHDRISRMYQRAY